MISSTLMLVAIVLVFARTLFSLFLEMLNMRNVCANAFDVPETYKGFVDADSYHKSVAYTLDKTRFAMIDGVYSALVLCAFLLFGAFPAIFDFCEKLWGASLFGQSLTVIAALTIYSLFDIPFDLYEQFVLEEKHGFNKMTLGLWIKDQIKSLLLSFVIGAPLLWLFLLFYNSFENTWWLWCFFAIVAVQLVMIMIYPKLILPLFNKITPLPDGVLKDAIFALAKKCNFKTTAIQVMDGSRRSSHSNAFFTGFGKFRRVIFYDTILEQLSNEQIVSVLAHEIGHYKKGHIWSTMFLTFASTLAGFYIMGVLAKCPYFYESFGFSQNSGFGALLILFSILSPLFTFWLTPIFNQISRKHEYQADSFAKATCGTPDNLIEALRKLHKKNLGNLTPHRLYSAFYYSHPTLMEREYNLKNN